MTTSRNISIVIPTRNEVKTIQDAILQYEPLLERYNMEVIVSDANSTDGTAEVVLEWNARVPDRIRLVQKPGKQNIAIGRNAGAAAAQGRILFITDADVRIPEPDRFFQTIIARFEQPKLAAFTTPIRIYKEEETLADKLFHWFMNAVIRFSLLIGWNLAKGECQIVRKSAFEQINGYDESLVAGEDCNLFYRLPKAGKVDYYPSLEVRHSPRRFRKYGYIGVSYIYLMEGISRLFAHKSYAKEWTVVR